jgi:hypothetical protein
MADITEVQGQLRKAGQVTLDSTGNGVLTFDPASARERWEVETVVVRTSQAATATVVPVATVGLNTVVASQLSQSNSRGQSWSGNQDIFSGRIDVGPCDYLSVIFTPAPGQNGSSMSGVIAYATVTGKRFTRRA